MYFVTFAVNSWIVLFDKRDNAMIVVDNLRYCQNKKGLLIYAWCLMPNHVHMVIQANGKQSLPEILRDFKSYTSKKLIERFKKVNNIRSRHHLSFFRKEVKSGYRLWQNHNKPIELWSNHVIDQKINYIHNNPVKAGLVERQTDYELSSAKAFAGENGLLEVIIP